MNLGYYPGCSLHGSSDDYQQSLKACFGALGASFKELDDWICCGATAAHTLNHKLSIALPARNLALAFQQGCEELVAPCSMCSMQLKKAQRALAHDPALAEEMSRIVEARTGNTRVLNLLQAFDRVGIETIKAAVKQPLKDLKVACYYGCLLTRPPEVLEFDDCEQPESMDKVVEALGATAVAWNYKTECCGASMTLANEETVLELSHRILADAAAHERAMHRRSLPHVPREPGHETVGHRSALWNQLRHDNLLSLRPGGTGVGIDSKGAGDRPALRGEEGINGQNRRLCVLVRREHLPYGRRGPRGRGGGQAARRALRGQLQVHLLRSRPGDDPREDRFGEAGRRGGGVLLAAHAPENLPQNRADGGSEPIPAGDGEHPRAMFVGASRPRPGDGEGR